MSNFVGWAYFDADGTYTMYNLDDIVHTKTNHVEPGTDGRGPGANGNQGGNGEYHFNNGNAR
ncbi:hypothetical protein ACFW9D_13750 [Streptomyces sp. NPDC059524]|uniref:hypothetical protein n=1 Tax=Streptomyces sp. NPDC059524 TaxID=3346856 RepID=UPI00369CD467